MTDSGERWQTEPGWVLLSNGEGSFLPFNQITSTAMLICDDGEAALVAARMLRAGCPVVDLPRGDDPPAFALICIDRVPADGLAVLVELRRVLGMAWPFSQLRELLAAQPIRAGGHNLATLHGELAAAPHLRPYLFREVRSRLTRIWTDAGRATGPRKNLPA